MISRIIDCDAVAFDMREATAELISDCKEQPALAIITVGDDAAAMLCANAKAAACESAGIRVARKAFGTDTTVDEVQDWIRAAVCGEYAVSGVIVQEPIVSEFITHGEIDDIFSEIPACMDVEGVSPEYHPLVTNCAALGVAQLLFDQYYIKGFEDCKLDGASVVVLGSGRDAEAIAKNISDGGATVTFCKPSTKDISPFINLADIVIVCTNAFGEFDGNMIKDGAVVIAMQEGGSNTVWVLSDRVGAIAYVNNCSNSPTMEAMLYNTAILKRIQEADHV